MRFSFEYIDLILVFRQTVWNMKRFRLLELLFLIEFFYSVIICQTGLRVNVASTGRFFLSFESLRGKTFEDSIGK